MNPSPTGSTKLHLSAYCRKDDGNALKNPTNLSSDLLFPSYLDLLSSPSSLTTYPNINFNFYSKEQFQGRVFDQRSSIDTQRRNSTHALNPFISTFPSSPLSLGDSNAHLTSSILGSLGHISSAPPSDSNKIRSPCHMRILTRDINQITNMSSSPILCPSPISVANENIEPGRGSWSTEV